MKSTPTPLQDRIMSLDVIRGFALLGILLANMTAFKTAVFLEQGLQQDIPALPDGVLHQAAVLFIDLFVYGKFYPMFSFLFGLGFYLFYERLIQKEFNATRLFTRRMVFLLLIGAIHFIFIWSGDILHTYAIAGFFLLLFIRLPAKNVLIWGISLILFTFVIMFSLLALSSFAMQLPYMADYVKDIEAVISQAYTVFPHGSYSEILLFRLQHEVSALLFNVFLAVPNVLGLFLIGLYLGKRGWFKDVTGHLRGWRRLCFHCLWSGCLLTALFVLLKYGVISVPAWLAFSLSEGVNIVAGPLLMLFYVSAIVLIMQHVQPHKWLSAIADVGRMALTNYLLQSVVCVFLFYGFGFGLFGSVQVGTGALIAIVLFLMQIVLSRIWLSKFKQGPLEKIWRLLTYKS